MNLYSGLPYWIVKNPLCNYFNPLSGDVTAKVAIIGSGITGSLVADELCRAGVDCCVIDKRSVSTGSTCASTALLQYEIDLPLCRLVEMMPEKYAVEAYRACLQSIDDLERILAGARVDAEFERVPSTYYASDRKGLSLIREEYAIRKRFGLPVTFLSKNELARTVGIKAPGALYNTVSAQIDTYKAATGLLARNLEKKRLRLYTHTEVTDWERQSDGYTLRTNRGTTIRCDYCVVAAGFEAAPFLPEKLMKLTTTFALISSPVESGYLWPGRSLIWETRTPYLYIRTDNSGRIIVGGEDVSANDAALRKFLLPRKSASLERRFHKLFPAIPFETEMAWAGTFSSTRDGLPLIGAIHDNPRMLYALGYGGNGITFSVIAAQIIAAAVQGKSDPREPVFSPERGSLR